MTPDLSRPAPSRDGASPQPGTRSATPSGFESVLWQRLPRDVDVDGLAEPDFFHDLNLDQALEAMVAGREQYELEPFFSAALHDVQAVRFRHEVLHDLERDDVRASVVGFGQRMRRMREHLDQVEKLHYRRQKQAWFLDAIEIYCEAVSVLASELTSLEIGSRGLAGLRAYLSDYSASEWFTSLATETQALKETIAEIRYAVHVDGGKVTVSRYDGEPDYSAEVEETFARFKQGAVKSYLVRLPDSVELDHVEAHILDFVSRLYPDVFRQLDAYCQRYRDYLDETIGRFDREVQFYLAHLELVDRLRAAGLSFCYPDVSARSKEIHATETFDLALAVALVSKERQVVCNDLCLQGPERMFVVSGPNNGGKTTFARTFGQLHHLASLGLLVPGREARLFLPDRIFTHFEKEEDIETLRGKFEDELVRVHEILDRATGNSVVVMNESFNSTTLNDALYVGTEVMQRILAIGCLGVYVTFVDEIASLGEATVSMVSQIVPENPAERTFKVVRKPADGLAYAWAIAEKYGLTYERLLERIDR